MLWIEAPGQGLRIARSVGADVTPAHGFRTGSITKPFTAARVLQLVEAGLFGLDDCLWDLLTPDSRACLQGLHAAEGRDQTASITIRHLLEHRSGLCDYAADEHGFFRLVMAQPDRSWSWQQTLAQYFALGLNRHARFAPGAGFHYADTNYLLLGLLVETLTRQTLAENYEKKIIAPLGLTGTFLEFFQAAPANLPIVYPYYGPHSLRMVNTSFDWGGGGLISTLPDLSRFIRALVSGELFNQASTTRQMLSFRAANDSDARSKRSTLYGLGLQQKTIGGLAFLGHSSAYGAMLFYNPQRDLTIGLALHQAAAAHKAEWLLHKAVEQLESV
jgi:D-alanyl-D-alanine carboxypeptidase